MNGRTAATAFRAALPAAATQHASSASIALMCLLAAAVLTHGRPAFASAGADQAPVPVAGTGVGSDAAGNTPLHDAVLRGDEPAAATVIAAGADVNTRNRYGVVPLYLAVLNGDAAMTRRLLAAGADANARMPGAGPILLAAARSGNHDVVAQLLAAGADSNVTEAASGQTPLMWAAAEGHRETVRALLAGGANVSARSRQHQSALFFAVRHGDPGTVEALLDSGADVNERLDPEETPTCDLCAKLPPGTRYSPEGDSMLVVAILNGHYDLAAALLDRGADPNAAGTRWAPLHALARARNYEELQYPAPPIVGELDGLDLAKRLIAHGADPNARAATMTAKRARGDQGYLEFKGATPFLLAAKAADIAMMRLLLAAGADPRLATDEQTTPLMVAAGIGCVPGQWIESERDVVQAVTLLVDELHADVNAVNMRQETALHGAVCRGAVSVIRYLAGHGARLDVRSAEGQTPLDAAVDGVNRSINVGGPNVILFRFPPETAAVLRELAAAQSTAVSQNEAR